MKSPFYSLVVGVLVVWRITHLLYGEDGPWNLFVRLRRTVGGGFWGSLLDCFYCLSLWVALPIAFLCGAILSPEGWKYSLLLWPALSAGAILLERVTNREKITKNEFMQNESMKNGAEQLPIYIEDEENEHVLR